MIPHRTDFKRSPTSWALPALRLYFLHYMYLATGTSVQTDGRNQNFLGIFFIHWAEFQVRVSPLGRLGNERNLVFKTNLFSLICKVHDWTYALEFLNPFIFHFKKPHVHMSYLTGSSQYPCDTGRPGITNIFFHRWSNISRATKCLAKHQNNW